MSTVTDGCVADDQGKLSELCFTAFSSEISHGFCCSHEREGGVETGVSTAMRARSEQTYSAGCHSGCSRTLGCCRVDARDTQQFLRSPTREDRLVLALRSQRASPSAPRICISPFLPPRLPRPPNGETEVFLSRPVEHSRRRRLEAGGWASW